jgi:hypothetical protein
MEKTEMKTQNTGLKSLSIFLIGLSLILFVNISVWASSVDLTPTGSGDDTSYLQTAINTYSRVTLTPGTYYVDAETSWSIPSNREIYFQEGAILQAIANDASDYRIILMQGVSNIKIYGPVCIGDKGQHTGSAGEGGHGIGIYGCSNIKIYNPTCNDCWGCGIGLVGCTDTSIYNAICDNNRQNGIAIVKGDNITLVNPKCINTSGTAPSAGIDIEPNTAGDNKENKNYTTGNRK